MSDSWRLTELESMPGVRGAVVATSDGLVRVESPSLGRETSEKLAAGAAPLASLARGLSIVDSEYDLGRLRETVQRHEYGNLFLREAGDLSVLIVLTDDQARPDLVAHEMQVQISRQLGGLSATARGV